MRLRGRSERAGEEDDDEPVVTTSLLSELLAVLTSCEKEDCMSVRSILLV